MGPKKWTYFRDVFRNGLLKQENEIFSVDRETSNLGYNIFLFLIWVFIFVYEGFKVWQNSKKFQNPKIPFLGIFVRKLCFYWFECGFSVLYSSKSIFWYKNQASLTLQWNFMRQNMLKNLVKMEAEGSYLGFGYQNTFIAIHVYF